MTAIPFPDIAPLPHQARAVLIVLLFFGLSSFAAVLDAKVDCQDQDDFLVTQTGVNITTQSGDYTRRKAASGGNASHSIVLRRTLSARRLTYHFSNSFR
jgi:hypothetical protein